MLINAVDGTIIHTLVSARVALLKAANPLQKVLGPPLLEDTHERAAQRLACIAGHFGHGCTGAAALLDVAAGNLLELEIAGDISMDEYLGELARRDDELGNQVDSVVAIASQLSGRGLIWPELAVQLSRRLCRCGA